MDKFTPPKTFPHECLTAGSGLKVTLWAPADNFGEYPATINGDSCKYTAAFKGRDLKDKPVVTKRWFNVYKTGASDAHKSRHEADEGSYSLRLYVIREETCDGEITIHKEDV